MVNVASIKRVEWYFRDDLVPRNSRGLNQDHGMIVRVHPRERNLDRGRKTSVIELCDEQWTRRIDAKLSGRKRIGVDCRGQHFGVRHLQASCDGVNLQSSRSRIEEADCIQHIDWNAKIARTSLDQWNRLLSHTGVPRNRKHGFSA